MSHNTMFSRIEYWRRFDFSMVSVVVLLTIIGVVMQYSAAQGQLSPWALAQMTRFILCIPVLLIIAMVNISLLYRMSYVMYVGALLLLLWVAVAGDTMMGATRWISLGGLRLQPSEIMKIAIVFALARYFHGLRHMDMNRLVYLVVPILLCAVPVGLVVLQPDLGTAIIIAGIAVTVCFVAGVALRYFVILAMLGLGSLPILWQLLHGYQKKRVLTFLHPDSDPLGAGYNILQSKIAIGSGGFLGKGLLQGTQSQLSFLPEHQTDFIFTMLAEEFGLLGCVVVLGLFALLLYRSMRIAMRCEHQFGRLLAMGMASFIFLHVFVNAGMVMGLLPIVGAPLPFLSYGGTMMLAVMVSIGLLLNVSLYRDTADRSL
jgi:rod shape determining protein RodA